MKRRTSPDRRVLISEIFHSLQGEGPWAGLPASFIRLAGCVPPLCPWCDTPYALEGGEEMTIGAVLAAMDAHPARRVVITGGEPFLQWERGLHELHVALLRRGCEIQYETSGKAGIPAVAPALVVLSPKRVAGEWLVDPGSMERADFLKFLAGSGESFEAIDMFVETHNIEKDRVFIMALGATRQEQLERMEAVFTFCAERGYRMSPRLHILVFDNRRGV
jgi:7-carboxy-7-deazaguanine synthase